MARSRSNPWLHRFAVLMAAATLCLVCIGGLVTSHGAGMAVPDWPTTFGYNLFFFPISKWVGGILYEHTHRLVASGVGLLTTVLAVWLWCKESRRWLRWLGLAALFAVVLQGVLGGLRVVLIKDEIGIFHATLAQLFFVLTCAIALFTSKRWTETRSVGFQPAGSGGILPPVEAGSSNNSQAGSLRYAPMLRRLLLGATALVLLQLILGATMRHQHAGLAISDFPLAHGKIWPAIDAASIASYSAQRSDLISL